MRPSDYFELIERLNTPKTTVIASPDSIENLHPHTPAEHPDWPTPRTIETAVDWLRRLPVRAALTAMITAAEMAVDFEAARYPDFKYPISYIRARRIIHQLWRIPAGERFALLHSYIESSLRTIFGRHKDENRYGGTATLGHVLRASQYPSCRNQFAESMFEAAISEFRFQNKHFHTHPKLARRQFLALWWARVRCRLAYADVLKIDVDYEQPEAPEINWADVAEESQVQGLRDWCHGIHGRRAKLIDRDLAKRETADPLQLSSGRDIPRAMLTSRRERIFDVRGNEYVIEDMTVF